MAKGTGSSKKRLCNGEVVRFICVFPSRMSKEMHTTTIMGNECAERKSLTASRTAQSSGARNEKPPARALLGSPFEALALLP